MFERRDLAEHYDAHGFGQLEPLAARLERTAAAVHQRIASLGLARTTVRRTWPKSLAELAREWGYDRHRIETAALRIGLELKRHRRAIAVTREQAELIKAELARHPDGRLLRKRLRGEWGLGQCCVGCGTTERPRLARERCERCYEAVRPGARR